METKFCKTCETQKNLSEFPDRKSTNGKIIKNSKCRTCLRDKQRRYRENNKQKLKEYDQKRYQDNKEEKKLRTKEYYQKNKEIIKEKQNNNPKLKKYRKEYYKHNKDRINEQNKNNQYKKINSDICFRLKHNIGNNIRRSLKRENHYKKSRTKEILGCSFKEFKEYLELQWEGWMNWDNYGKYNGEYGYGWDIDHIKPIASALTESELLDLHHYTNLQPLCSKINRDEKKDNLF